MFHVLVIGAGTMGVAHTEAYKAMKDVHIAGIVDFQEEKAKKLANGKIDTFSSFESAIENVGKVDAIDICLPTFLHKEYVKKSADLGKHVICEKPLARNLEDAREMIEYCSKKNVRLFVGHVLRFFPVYQRAKEIIESGEIGKIGIARMRRGGIFPTAWNDWYAHYKNSGGLVLDMIIHDFDFLRWCFGEVDRVYAKSLLNRNLVRKDYALVTLRFKTGVIAHVEGSWAHQGFSMAFEFAGEKGIIEYDSAEDKPLKPVIHEQQKEFEGVAVPESPLRENPYFRELQHFIRCIEIGEQPIISAEDAYKALEISLAVLHSIEIGKPVTI